MTRILDLFAGPGGWSEGLRTLGYSETGIEWDEAACATARAAGHERIQADVSELHPLEVGLFSGCRGLIASPPCPTFSAAGGGAGRHLTEIIVACLRALSEGRDTRAEARAEAFETLQPVAWEAEQAKAKKAGREPDRERADARARRDADMSILVIEPLRWALALRPEWVALEQVPEVLPLWGVMASLLQAHGYSTWTGKLEAERFGVPQTRERAILIAHRSRAVVPPEPTHQRYVPGEPQRHEATMFGEVLPWVSMAEALGWGTDDVMRSNYTDGTTGEPGEREGSEPGFVVTGKFNRNFRLRASGEANATTRDQDEPAPTIKGGHDRRQGRTREDGTRDMVRAIPVDEPAPTIASDGLLKGRDVWTHERPSTTVNGDPRISEPGRHDPNESGSQQKNAVRVTVEEAAILQSFRPDYPWQGSRTKQFEQVGNAVPPMLARAVLSVLIDDLMTAVRATEKAA